MTDRLPEAADASGGQEPRGRGRAERAPDLRLDPLGERAWRLRDRAIGRDDAQSVLAYVEQRDGETYAVTWVVHGFGTGTYATHDAILRHASQLLSEVRGGTASKPIPIPHRPPTAAP